MKEIKILGTDCAKCRKLAKNAEEAAQALGIEFTIEKVEDIQQIIAYGAMITPALVVDGDIKVSGTVPNQQAIQEMLK